MKLFGLEHGLILLAIAAAAALLSRTSRRSESVARAIRIGLGVFLAVNEAVWWTFRYSREGSRFPEGLPLELCDVAVWVAVFACLRENRAATEFLYFAGLGGAGQALLTPDLWAPLASYPSIYFFLVHGAVVTAAIVLVVGARRRLPAKALLRAFGLLNLYAVAVGAFNAVFGTNYFYLCRKPNDPSLLDWFGPWPYYIAVGQLFTMAMFALLWLPVRERMGRRP